MARVLVTGGAGFIGSNIAEELVSRGFDVMVLDNFSAGNPENLSRIAGMIELKKGDIRDEELVGDCLKDIDYVIHEAAFVSVPESIKKPEMAYDINVKGTLNILSAAAKSGAKRFVFASSCAVYGESGGPQKEDASPCPLSPYALAKLIGEKYCKAFTETCGMETISLRYFNVFGPRQSPKSDYAAVIPKFITNILENKPPVIYGDGNQTRDFVFVRDVVQANMLALSARDVSGKVFNVGSGKVTSINSLLRSICELSGRGLKPRNRRPRPGDIKHSLADISNAREQLGYEPGHTLEEGLGETIEWFKGSAAGSRIR